jgi:hypothetical protein
MKENEEGAHGKYGKNPNCVGNQGKPFNTRGRGAKRSRGWEVKSGASDAGGRKRGDLKHHQPVEKGRDTNQVVSKRRFVLNMKQGEALREERKMQRQGCVVKEGEELEGR